MQTSLASERQRQACHGPSRLAMARYRWAREVGRGMLGEPDTHQLDVPPAAADDFAFLAELAPALYLRLGDCGSQACPRSHSAGFDADERAVGIGAAISHEIGQRLLTRPLESWVQA